MKTIKILLSCTFIVVVLTTVGFTAKGISENVANETATEEGFALLELFTSEGCSSCPPADELLGKIQNENRKLPVYVLAYHVDYWDRMGWKDRFSSAANTQRQYSYSQKLGSQVYTPQVVVNGQAEFVGSDTHAAENALKNALKTKTNNFLNLTGTTQGNTLRLEYEFKNFLSASEKLNVAIVQKNAVSNIKRGENQGRTLNHFQIVTKRYEVDPKSLKKGTFNMILPDNFNVKDWEIIGFVQDTESYGISAAARADLK